MPQKRRTCTTIVGFKDKLWQHCGGAFLVITLLDTVRGCCTRQGWLRSWVGRGLPALPVGLSDSAISLLATAISSGWAGEGRPSTCRFWSPANRQVAGVLLRLGRLLHACRNYLHWAAPIPQQNKAQPAAATALSSTETTPPSKPPAGLGPPAEPACGDSPPGPTSKERRRRQPVPDRGPTGRWAPADQLPQRRRSASGPPGLPAQRARSHRQGGAGRTTHAPGPGPPDVWPSGWPCRRARPQHHPEGIGPPPAPSKQDQLAKPIIWPGGGPTHTQTQSRPPSGRKIKIRPGRTGSRCPGSPSSWIRQRRPQKQVAARGSAGKGRSRPASARRRQAWPIGCGIGSLLAAEATAAASW